MPNPRNRRIQQVREKPDAPAGNVNLETQGDKHYLVTTDGKGGIYRVRAYKIDVQLDAGDLGLGPGGTTGQLQWNEDGEFGGISEGNLNEILASSGPGQPPRFVSVEVPATPPGGTHGQVQFNDNDAFGGLPEGTQFYVMKSNGAGAPPTFQALTAGGDGDLQVRDGQELGSVDPGTLGDILESQGSGVPPTFRTLAPLTVSTLQAEFNHVEAIAEVDLGDTAEVEVEIYSAVISIDDPDAIVQIHVDGVYVPGVNNVPQGQDAIQTNIIRLKIYRESVVLREHVVALNFSNAQWGTQPFAIMCDDDATGIPPGTDVTYRITTEINPSDLEDVDDPPALINHAIANMNNCVLELYRQDQQAAFAVASGPDPQVAKGDILNNKVFGSQFEELDVFSNVSLFLSGGKPVEFYVQCPIYLARTTGGPATVNFRLYRNDSPIGGNHNFIAATPSDGSNGYATVHMAMVDFDPPAGNVNYRVMASLVDNNSTGTLNPGSVVGKYRGMELR